MEPIRASETDSGSPSRTEAAGPSAPRAHWSTLTRIAFRFGFVYLGLYNLETPLYLLAFPPFVQISALYQTVRGKGVLWVSKHVLHLSHDFGTDFQIQATGTKDSTYAWVQVLCFLVIAVLATLIWSLFDRKRQEYVWLQRWFMVYLRLSLACALIPYGAIKIFPWQFPPASLPNSFSH